MNELVKTNGHSMAEMQAMASSVVKSGLFPGVKTEQAAMTLMLLCVAEGLHPITAMRRYNLIQGQPAMKADAMLAEFQRRGGKVAWLEHTPEACEAEFMSEGLSKPVRVRWTMEDAKRAGLSNKQNWHTYPRQMLRARVISEGIRMADPGVNQGIYTVEEVMDFDRAGTDEKPLWPKALTDAEVQAKKERGELKGQREWHRPIPKDVVDVAEAEAIEGTPPPVDDEPPAILSKPDPKAGAAWLEHKRAMTADIDRGDFQAKLEAVSKEVSEKIEKEKARDSGSMFHGSCDHPGCSAVLVTGVSESEKDRGREYWICHWAAQEKARMKKEGFADKAIALAIKEHTRMWKKAVKA